MRLKEKAGNFEDALAINPVEVVTVYSKRHLLLSAVVGVAIGFGIALAMNGSETGDGHVTKPAISSR